jgi:hypothetical protein
MVGRRRHRPVAHQRALEEPSMICRIYDVPGATLDQYDAVDRQIGRGAPFVFRTGSIITFMLLLDD